MNCVIIDDEPLAREGLSTYVREIDFLRLVGSCENSIALTKVMDETKVDLIFLDIQMPKMNGMEFLKITKDPPIVIITSAYPSYALESFQLNVLDYLLKPITFDRFFQAVKKAKEYFQLISGHAATSAEANSYFFIKCESKYEKIFFDDILYIEGMQNYVRIYTTKGKYMTLLNLKDIEQNLQNGSFIRVHKSFIVNITRIDCIEKHEISIQSTRIPISRNFREHVIEKIVNDKLWKK
ncbi:MAG TPA: LytTR family DNA-binding domain-containing protein [Chryseolinea sp.]|nr:LytTR family DNA-binding domain-containing protein [Chryseolinea sp.]